MCMNVGHCNQHNTIFIICQVIKSGLDSGQLQPDRFDQGNPAERSKGIRSTFQRQTYIVVNNKRYTAKFLEDQMMLGRELVDKNHG